MGYTIEARTKWNHTGYRLQAGVAYDFTATGEWIDLDIPYTPDGGPSSSGKPIQRLVLRLTESFRRRKKDNWFALIGAVGEDESTTFLIGSSLKNFVPIQDGELTCYANDVGWAYFNNKGSVTLTVKEAGKL